MQIIQISFGLMTFIHNFFMNYNLYVYLLLFLLPYKVLTNLKKKVQRQNKEKKEIEIIEEISDQEYEPEEPEENDYIEYITEYEKLYNAYDKLNKYTEELIKNYENLHNNYENVKESKMKYKKSYKHSLELYDDLLTNYKKIYDEKEYLLKKNDELEGEVVDREARIWSLKEKIKQTNNLLTLNQEEVLEKKHEIIKLRNKVKNIKI